MSIEFSGGMADDERIISTRQLSEDETENSLRPKTMADYIGQTKAKENLSVYIEAAKMRGESLDHTLLYASLPASARPRSPVSSPPKWESTSALQAGPAIEKAGDLAALLTNLSENDILFIDEIHRLDRAVEEILYPAMEDYALDIIIGKGLCPLHTNRPAALYADRRNNPRRSDDQSAARPLRRHAPSRAVFARGALQYR